VYQLPEAQRDRFLMKVTVDYPGDGEELAILYRLGTSRPSARPVLDPASLIALQQAAHDVFVHHAVAEYVVRLVLSTRQPQRFGAPDVAPHLAYGASPRATLGLTAAARALALIRGRDYVLPDDVRDLAVDVIAHRLVLSFEAVADGITAEALTQRLVEAVPPPRITAVTGGPGLGAAGNGPPQAPPPQAQPQAAPPQAAPPGRKAAA
jgi:MoxR-like ATPase